MKKFIVFVLVISMMGLLFFVKGNNPLFGFKNMNINYEILSSNNDGFLVSFNRENLSEVLDFLELQNVSKKYISDRLIIEGYSYKVSNYVNVNNLRINIQLSVDENDKVLCGSPLIYGSF